MSDPEVKPTPAERQAAELAASLDAVAEDLEHNGPVPAAEVRRVLEAADREAEAHAEAVREGIAAADAGRTLPHEDVRLWVLSWGTPGEFPRPQRR